MQVHKAQGMTLPGVILKLDRCWTWGQVNLNGHVMNFLGRRVDNRGRE